jgi:ATP-dependent Lon protease
VDTQDVMKARNELEFIFVSRMDEVLKAALEKDPFKNEVAVPPADPAKPEVRG